ncbi:hypothetical protein VTG60DRAFT_7359 [Thermothelomyces hinnuleus]
MRERDQPWDNAWRWMLHSSRVFLQSRLQMSRRTRISSDLSRRHQSTSLTPTRKTATDRGRSTVQPSDEGRAKTGRVNFATATPMEF